MVGETEGFCYFCILESFNCRWVRVVVWSRESYLGSAEITSSCSWFYSGMENMG